MLSELPINNPQQLRAYLHQNFYPAPQLLGGNHTTAAFKKVLKRHTTTDKHGKEEFTTPEGSKFTPAALKKFIHRSVHFVISPLPFKDSLVSHRIKHGLLCLARQLNDTAKQVKSATLYDQLTKARRVLETFLENAVDPTTSKKYFSAKQSVWPNSHGDLQRSIYSAKGIQTEVLKVLSQEFTSSVSAIKLLCTCPEDVFQLLIKITAIQLSVGKKGDEMRYAVNSTKSLAAFTLTYCTKANLLQNLENILSGLRNKKGKKFILSTFASTHVEVVKFNAMLNYIVTDIKTFPNEKRAAVFLKKLGDPNSEGFYEEFHFQEVT